MPEISQAELDILRRGHTLLEKLVSDKDKGIEVQKQLKAIDPTLRFPALDTEPLVAPVAGKVSELEARLNKLDEDRTAERTAAADNAAETKLRKQLESAQKKFKLTDDGMNGVIEVMKERQLADPEAAAALYLRNLPKPAKVRQSSFAPDRMDLFGAGQKHTDESIQQLHKDPVGWQDQEITKILNEQPLETEDA